MDILQGRLNEQEAAKAFSKQAAGFDIYDAENTIIQYKRRRVREHVLRFMPEEGSILELNSGTGIDAAWFARLGYRVHATDIAIGMQEKLRAKMVAEGLADRVTMELCSFTDLDRLRERGPYDLVFSNFAGLNCTGELGGVLRSLTPLIKPGGQVTLVILPKFCLWESMLLMRGRWKTATRRWFSGRKGTRSHVEGYYFRCWYYSPSFVIDALKDSFELIGQEGLCTFVPPSYIEHFAEKHPRAYGMLKSREDRWKGSWPWKSIGDYYIISFRKK